MGYKSKTASAGLSLGTDSPPHTTATYNTNAKLIDSDLYTYADVGYVQRNGINCVGLDFGAESQIAKLEVDLYCTDAGNYACVWTSWANTSTYEPLILKVFSSANNSAWTFVETFQNITMTRITGSYFWAELPFTTVTSARYFKIVCGNTDLSKIPGFNYTGGSGSYDNPGGRLYPREVRAYSETMSGIIPVDVSILANSVHIDSDIPGSTVTLSADVSVTGRGDIDVEFPEFDADGVCGALLTEDTDFAEDFETEATASQTLSGDIEVDFESFIASGLAGGFLTSTFEDFSCASAASMTQIGSLISTFPDFETTSTGLLTLFGSFSVDFAEAFEVIMSAKQTTLADIEATFPSFIVSGHAITGLLGSLEAEMQYAFATIGTASLGITGNLTAVFENWTAVMTVSVEDMFDDYVLRYERT